MFAMVCSFLLSRTLVPTMANYLLRKHDAHADGKPPTRNPLVLFQRGFETRFERFRAVYHDLLGLALRNRTIFICGFMAFVLASFLLAPFLGRNFFPSVDSGQILMHVRGPIGTRVEESAHHFAAIQKAIRTIIPSSQIATMADNVGMPVSGINMAYNNTGTIGPQDGDIQIKLVEDHRPTDAYVAELRRRLPEMFPGFTFSFLPAALAGIVWMLFVTNTTLSVPALTGAIMCMGVATANSVLVISFARERLAELGDATAAALDAGFVRFRPVIMTALAMIIGMAPMALGMGEGGEQNAPLGRAVIGGLVFATIATLMFVPVVFSVVHRHHGKAASVPAAVPGAPHVA